jgi:cytochrome c oxidase subunit 1
VATAVQEVVHVRGAEFLVEERAVHRRIAWLFVITGVLLFALMGLLGLAMRLTQADVLGLSASWFYRFMTLHGSGMLVGALMAMMGGLWFVLRPDVPLGLGRVLTSYGTIVLGSGLVVVATLAGGFAPGWTFLWPLPFASAGQWSTWATVTFLVGMILVGSGFFVYCADVLQRVTATYGGLVRALGIPALRGRPEEAGPPPAIAATVVSIAGLVASAVGTTMLMTLLVRAMDTGVRIDALWAKNLTYFFGHTVANLIIYLGAGLVYVLLPRFAGRPWKTTKPIVVGWLATLVLVLTAYSHHLYMDFVQPAGLQYMSAISSFAAALPVAVVTIFTGMMLVWGSRYRWTLASTLLYLGFVGWAIGGTGAVIDSVVPVNFRLHNTLWVPGHFHTYLLLGVIFWALALLTHLLERAAGRPAARWPSRLAVAAMLVGGYGLVAAWYVSGALGVPRRFAVHPPGTDGYSLGGSIFAMIFAVGFLVLLLELLALALGAKALRIRPAAAPPPTLGQVALQWAEFRSRLSQAPAPPADVTLGPPGARRRPAAPTQPLPPPPLTRPAEFAVCLALAVASIAAFFPPIADPGEDEVRLHHLAHAGQFLFGLALGLVIACLPSVFGALSRRRWAGDAGLAAVIVAPALMLLVMAPGVYESLEGDPALHALYHVGVAALGFVTGVGCACLGRLTGRIVFVASFGMGLMYAAGVTGG